MWSVFEIPANLGRRSQEDLLPLAARAMSNSESSDSGFCLVHFHGNDVIGELWWVHRLLIIASQQSQTVTSERSLVILQNIEIRSSWLSKINRYRGWTHSSAAYSRRLLLEKCLNSRQPLCEVVGPSAWLPCTPSTRSRRYTILVPIKTVCT